MLRSAPLVGPASVFGERPGDEQQAADGARRLVGFSPVPGFRFDVELREPEPGTFLAAFSQPTRARPYLDGDAVWQLSDDAGAVFHEEINTDRARAAGGRPLTGARPSLRRWLFFRFGHARVMSGAIGRIAALAASR